MYTIASSLPVGFLLFAAGESTGSILSLEVMVLLVTDGSVQMAEMKPVARAKVTTPRGRLQEGSSDPFEIPNKTVTTRNRKKTKKENFKLLIVNCYHTLANRTSTSTRM